MKTYEAVISYGLTTQRVIVQARSKDEAMDQALLSVGKSYLTVARIAVSERREQWAIPSVSLSRC